MQTKRAFYIGLTGSLLGIIIIAVTMLPFGNIIDMKLYSNAMGVAALIFSLVALCGCFLLKRKKVITASFCMLIAAVGGIISMSLYYVAPGFLLIIGGMMAIMHEGDAQ